MNLKRTFGALLTLMGMGGLIYTAIVFTDTSNSTKDIKELIIYGILGIVFFVSGINLVKTTKDAS
jgi:cell division protein FtsW (lipid II flippase)